MCPVCIATAALIAGKAASSGGLAAVAIKKFGVKKSGDRPPAATESKLSETRT
jgi:Pyruvate/2-oxoacid:ferredoxin oxidoreductase gamma subunit